MRTPPPAVVIHAVEDPGIVERGRYLVYGPTHCAACHGDPARESEMRRGGEIPLSGGREFDLGALGTLVAPNITSDPRAGIGSLSDEILVRSFRYGISRHGRPLVPFMSFAGLCDEDLRAILSFLRTLPPSSQSAPRTELSWLGALLVRFAHGAEKPTPSNPSLAKPEHSAEYGGYLARAVANCRGCHTRRSRHTGAYVGREFAGGMEFEEGGRRFVAPNLTPIAAGIVHLSTEQQFIGLFRDGNRRELGSPMPWAAFARMTDGDLGAIYLYLNSLPPTETR